MLSIRHWTNINPSICIPLLPKYSTWPSINAVGVIFCLWSNHRQHFVSIKSVISSLILENYAYALTWWENYTGIVWQNNSHAAFTINAVFFFISTLSSAIWSFLWLIIASISFNNKVPWFNAVYTEPICKFGHGFVSW